MSTGLIEGTKLETKIDDPGDHDRFAHFFSKRDLDRALLDGAEITALCGKVDRPLRGIEGRSVCTDCKEIWTSLD
jgi:hypothetical protein